MTIQIYPNCNIGIKKISDAELGLTGAHLSHIGLFESTGLFLDDNVVVPSQLIYSGLATEMVAFWIRIKRANGKIEAPRIKADFDWNSLGQELYLDKPNLGTVYHEIMHIAKKERDRVWFLLWLALDTKQFVFFLFNDLSDEFLEVEEIYGHINHLGKSNWRDKVNQDDSRFNNLMNYLDSKFEPLSLSNQIDIELEQAALAGNNRLSTGAEIAPRDFEKAQERIKETGKKGEELLNDYFETERSNNRIKDFIWENANKESGKEYDFKITLNDDQILYVDAKSTIGKFIQSIFISSGELKSISKHKENYHIYRLYSVDDEPKMRICKNIFEVAEKFLPHYEEFKSSLKKEYQNLNVSGISLSVPVDLDVLIFDEEIRLPN